MIFCFYTIKVDEFDDDDVNNIKKLNKFRILEDVFKNSAFFLLYYSTARSSFDLLPSSYGRFRDHIVS